MQARALPERTKTIKAGWAPVALAVVLLGVAAACWLAGRPLGVDAAVYRAGALAVTSGEPLYGSLAALPEWSPDLPFLYPPFAVLVFLPLAALPVQWAWGVLAVASVAALWCVVRVFAGGRQAPRLGPWTVPALFAVAFCLEPVWRGLALGQINLIVMAMIAVDVLGRRGSRWSGVMIGLAAAVKLTPLLFVVHLLVTGRRADACRAAATFGAVSLLAALVLPGDSARFWTHVVFAGNDLDKSWAGNQSIYALLVRSIATDRVPVPYAVLAVLFVAATVFVVRDLHRRADQRGALLTTACCALLISPISWTHHWVWVVPLVTFLVARFRWTRGKPFALAGLAFVFVGGLPMVVPTGEGREHDWTVAQGIVGNAYLLAGAACLTVLVARTVPCRARMPLAGRLERGGSRVPEPPRVTVPADVDAVGGGHPLVSRRAAVRQGGRTADAPTEPGSAWEPVGQSDVNLSEPADDHNPERCADRGFSWKTRNGLVSGSGYESTSCWLPPERVDS